VLAVLLVGDMLSPGRAVALVVNLEHREMGHEVGGGGAMPVLLTRLEEDAVARADDLDGAAAPLHAAHTLCDVDGLAVGVGVPGCAGARREVDAARL
jgi:hypothetical protein